MIKNYKIKSIEANKKAHETPVNIQATFSKND